MDYDRRHLAPLVADMGRLALGSLYRRRSRSALVDVGRAVRHSAFEASDDFPAIPFPELVAQLSDGAASSDVQLPPVDRLWGNTIGGLIPYYYLATLAAAIRPRTVFEVGTYLGLSALTFALNAPDAEVITVDLPDEMVAADTDTLTRGDKSLVLQAVGNVGRALRGHPLAKRVTQVRCSSLELDAETHLRGRPVDLALIDGGHSYELVRNDTEKLLPYLSPTGLMIWDDYRWNLPGVSRYLRELLRELPLRRIAGSQYVIYSPAMAE